MQCRLSKRCGAVPVGASESRSGNGCCGRSTRRQRARRCGGHGSGGARRWAGSAERTGRGRGRWAGQSRMTQRCPDPSARRGRGARCNGGVDTSRECSAAERTRPRPCDCRALTWGHSPLISAFCLAQRRRWRLVAAVSSTNETSPLAARLGSPRNAACTRRQRMDIGPNGVPGSIRFFVGLNWFSSFI